MNPNLKGINHLVIFLLISATLAGLNVSNVHGQSSETGSWSEPVNLSKSGGTASPYAVTDSNGIIHVFWNDLYADMAYSQGDGITWESARPINLPFKDSVYKIIPDNRGRLMALWMDADYNFYSSVAIATESGREAGWQNQILIARGVVGFDGVVDANNQFHVVFALASEALNLPTGVYYVATGRETTTWGNPRLLYESRYYRTLLPPPGSFVPASSQGSMLTRVSITASVQQNETHVFAGWEDRALKRAYYATFSNGSWSDPILIDGPETLASYQYPRNVVFYSRGARVLMLWERSDQNGPVCSQQYQYSSDNGQSWSPQAELWKEFGACPEEFQFLETGQDFALIFAKVQSQVFLLLWDGSRFSIPQNQIELISLQNPDTLDVIDFSCQRGALKDNLLITVGCDLGVGGDIWVLSRRLEYSDAWFDQGITWSPPMSVTIGDKSITSINAVDYSGELFTFWSGPSADITSDFPAISVVSWDGLRIAGPYELHRVREGMPTDVNTMVIRESQRIVQMWQAGIQGEIFYSWAGARDATNPVNWSEFAPLSSDYSIGESPRMIQSEGRILAFYSIQFNDQRGIYQTQSMDNGSTWDIPKLIADIRALNCEGVGHLSVGNDARSHIHLVFSCATQPGGVGAVEFYGMRSTDAGASWSRPVLISDKSVPWSRVIAVGDNLVYRFWSEAGRQTEKLWFSISKDRGASWETAGNFFTSETPILNIDLVVDQKGDVHLLMARSQENLSTPLRVEYLHWNSTAWERGQTLQISRSLLSKVDGLSIAISSGNILRVAIAGLVQDISGRTESRIIFSQLTLQNLEQFPNPTPQETLSVITAEPVVTDTPVPEVTITPVNQDFSRQPESGVPPWMGIVAGGFLSILLVVGVIIINRIHKKNL